MNTTKKKWLRLEKSARILQWKIMASLTYVCFVPAKGLIIAQNNKFYLGRD